MKFSSEKQYQVHVQNQTYNASLREFLSARSINLLGININIGIKFLSRNLGKLFYQFILKTGCFSLAEQH